jgi:hypothetical protein
MLYDNDEVANAPRLGAASEQYNDWLGTIALDDPHDASSELDPLYALSGLDREQWSIVGVSMAGGRIGVGDLSSAASVYAVSREIVTRFRRFRGSGARIRRRHPRDPSRH